MDSASIDTEIPHDKTFRSRTKLSGLWSGFSLPGPSWDQLVREKKYNAHTDPLFKKLKFLKIEDLFTISKYAFDHRHVNNKLSINLQRLPWLP